MLTAVTRTATVATLIAVSLLAACMHTDAVSARAPAARRGRTAEATSARRAPGKAVERTPEPGRKPPRGSAAAAAEPIEGFGAGARGGEGGRVIVIDDTSEDNLRKILNDVARTGNATVRFEVDGPIEITRPLPHLTSPHVTIDGNGATLDGSGLQKQVALIDIRTNDVIVRNLRLRNGYDNLRLNGPDAYDVAVSHVSSTGAIDDGISVGYGAHDVTVQYAFVAGNTRSFFCKYDGTAEISLHHSWFQKGWIRSPLISGAVRADVRNVIVEDWAEWGARFENGASGNVVNSLFTLSPYARRIGGKPAAALRFVESGPVYASGNVVRGEALPIARGTADAPVKVPPVRTASVAEMEKDVRSHAGCLPRDEVDDAYIMLQTGWHVSESEPLRNPPPEKSPPVIERSPRDAR